MTTKEQERAALEKIRKIVDGLGENSYIATAIEGCFEIAEINIENDFADSMKGRAEIAERDAKKYVSEIVALTARLNEAAAAISLTESEVSALKEQVKAAQAMTMQNGLYVSLYNLVDDDRERADRDMAQAAETMAHYADQPQDIAFQSAVKNYRKQAKRRSECEQIITELEKIEPKGV